MGKGDVLHIGFTGTRNMDAVLNNRIESLAACLFEFGDEEPFIFHHGDCVGADAYAHSIVLQIPNAKIHVHPPSNARLRAGCRSHYEEEPLPYMDRNKQIVKSAGLMLALPTDPEREVLRSGTWATVRAARKADVPLLIF